MPGLLVKILPPPEFRIGSFRDSIEYARGATHDSDKDRVPERDIDGNMPMREDGHRGQLIDMQGVSSVDSAALEMDAVAAKSRTEDPVLHMVLAYGEQVDPDLVAEDARALLAVIGAEDHQYVVFGHADKSGNYHAHLIASAVHPTRFRKYNDSHNFAKLECEATRINYARGWRIIPGKFNGNLIKQYAREAEAEIALDKRSLKEKTDELEKIRTRNSDIARRCRHQNRSCPPAKNGLPKRAPRRPQHLADKRLRPLPTGELVRPAREPRPLLHRDVSADGSSRRRLRSLEARDQRNEQSSGSLIPDHKQQAAQASGKLSGAIVLGPQIHAAFSRGTDLRDIMMDLYQHGISTRITIDTVKATGRRLPKISFARDGLFASGSQIELKASVIEAKYGLLDENMSTDKLPVISKEDRIQDRDPGIVARNAALRTQFEAYHATAKENRKIERANLRERAKVQIAADRYRELYKLERSLYRKNLFWDAFFSAATGRGQSYRGYKRNRVHPLKSWIKKRLYAAHKKRKDAVYGKYRQSWKTTIEKVYATDALYGKPMAYRDWLMDQPSSPDVVAELATITANRFSSVPTLTPVARLDVAVPAPHSLDKSTKKPSKSKVRAKPSGRGGIGD